MNERVKCHQFPAYFLFRLPYSYNAFVLTICLGKRIRRTIPVIL